MVSPSASMPKRKSIGLANLVDAASPSQRARRARRRKSKLAVELSASKDGDALSAASPTTVVEIPTHETRGEGESEEKREEEDEEEEEDSKPMEQKVEHGTEDVEGFAAEPFLEPTTPRGSAVSAVALFEAIATDSFFDVMARLRIELCASEEDAQRVREDARTKSVTQAVVDVNGFKDSTQGKTLLHQACKFANFQVIKCLLYNGASPRMQCVMGRTPFHEVISSGKRERALEVLKMLHEYDPQGICLVDINGTHVTHLAAIHGCLDVVQWCGDLSTRTDAAVSMSITSFSGRNMLHYAAYNGRLLVLEWLLQGNEVHGPSIASLDLNGYSVLHYAAMGGHLNVCKWLVYEAPSRRDLNIVGTNSDGNSALDLAKQADVQSFLEEVSQVPEAPTSVSCIGVDTCSMGVSWKYEPATDNQKLAGELAPKWFELEYCKKPAGLRRASAVLSVLMIVPSDTASAAALSASSYLLDWETLDVFIQPDSREFWLSGLESDCEYLVRMRTFNRNGYSDYCIPSLTGEFKTTGPRASEAKPKRRSFFNLLAPSVSRSVSEVAFIGTVHFELLEARRLLHCSSQEKRTRREAAEQGRFFAVVSLQLLRESESAPDGPQRRRSSLSLSKSEDSVCARSETNSLKRFLYQVRTDYALVQQELLLSGTLHAFRHPHFGLSTQFRVPEALNSDVVVEVHHETPSAQSTIVGVASVPLVELIRGFPAKLQWLSLEHGPKEMVCDETHGEILIRSLFLADGITCLPHPTKDGVMCTSAQELLDEAEEPSSPPVSNTTVTTASSSASNSPLSDTSTSPVLSPTSHSLNLTMKDLRKYDALGFRIFSTQDSTSQRNYEYYRQHQLRVCLQQDRLWSRFHGVKFRHRLPRSSFIDMLRTTDDIAFYEPSADRHSSRLQHLVWGGIPLAARPTLYMRMSGASRKRRQAGTGYYQRILKRAMELKARADESQACPDVRSQRTPFDMTRRQVQVDLQRTFAGSRSWINCPEGQAAMERVLLAYAVHNESIGYCQSMSFIAGRLLCLFHDHDCTSEPITTDHIEERVFWLLAALCEDYFPKNYSKGMEGLHVDGFVLEKLLQRRLPKLTRHIQVVLHNPPQIGLLLVTGWLLPIFCAVFPSETSFRLLDVLIYEGSSAVFSLVIALLRMAQPQILSETKDYMQLFRLLKERDQRLHDTALLMEIALDEHLLLEKDITTLREQCELQYQESRRSQEQEQQERRSLLKSV